MIYKVYKKILPSSKWELNNIFATRQEADAYIIRMWKEIGEFIHDLTVREE